MKDDFEVWLDDILSDLEHLIGPAAGHSGPDHELRNLEMEVARFLGDQAFLSPILRERMASRVADLEYDLDVARSIIRPSPVRREFDSIIDEILTVVESGGRFGGFEAEVWRGFFERLVALRSRSAEIHSYETELSGPLEAAIAYVQGVRNAYRLAPFTPRSHVRRVTRSRRR